VLVVACSGGSEGVSPGGATTDAGGRGGELVGQACKAPTDCYQQLEGAAVKGEVQCLTRVTNGYCTHLCTSDADCCAVPGECKTGFKQVCAPFESTGLNMCFLSCEDGDLHAAPDAGAGAPVLDSTVYCQTYASTELICRSTGGGRNNRKVCVPGGGTGLDAGDGGG
jgi:hypothetical protein